MGKDWTSERRPRQAALIRTRRPWEQSTGPRTPDGKANASGTAYKGEHWQMLREPARVVNVEIRKARDLVERVNA